MLVSQLYTGSISDKQIVIRSGFLELLSSKKEVQVSWRTKALSCRRDKVTGKRYLYPIRHSRSSLNYRKKGQLAQLVRESDERLFSC